MATPAFEDDPTHTKITDADQAAQRHPEGNVPGHIESPETGLPVDDGQPSGEQDGEERETGDRIWSGCPLRDRGKAPGASHFLGRTDAFLAKTGPMTTPARSQLLQHVISSLYSATETGAFLE